MKQIEKNNNHLWQVELTLTGDYDPQLQELTKRMQEDTEGSTGWFRLGRLMMKVAQLDKAQKLFEMILHQTTDETEKSKIYHYLGWIKMDQGKNTEAIRYYEKSLQILQKTLPANHPSLATLTTTSKVCMTTWASTRKHFHIMKKHLKSRKKLFPQIILN